PQAEVGDPERLADRGLVGLEPLRLLERHRRLRGHALAQPPLPLLEAVVRLAHSSRSASSRIAAAITCFGAFGTRRSPSRVRSTTSFSVASKPMSERDT